ncbi:MAG TPA: DUF2231 domain-containing protein [Phycisphaerae bacterium]|nr:DUF2231 domain-containing protein [Phycisphaerae bacterium]
MELWQRLGELHPKLVQFPLVLLLMGLLFDLGGLIARSRQAHWAGKRLTAVGTMGLLFAFICGIYAEIWAGRAGVPQDPIEYHELMANLASWGFVVLMAWRLFLRTDPDEGRRGAVGAYLAIGFGWYLLLAVTAYLGGQLVFQYGAAVQGASANTITSMDDLNTLACRQTDENLRYSEWMHHIFGWMTLGLAASLLAQAIWPGRARKLRWIVPTFLLIGGLFLLLAADLDLYALTDMRQFASREVQLHKALAVIMTVIGAVGLRKVLKKSARETPADTSAADARAGNSRLVAVLALIGGSLLFTHVHGVAPYANVAAGVYIAHVVLGAVALAIGATRIAQDKFPHWKRPLAITFALFMAIESLLLISYNEGLPWYIGYGRYNRWAPGDTAHVGNVVIAPYGPVRAALRVDPSDGKAYLDVLDKQTDAPAPVAADKPLMLLVQHGYQQTAIPLAAMTRQARPARYQDPGHAHDLTASHFEGQAELLKVLPGFSASLALPLDGKNVMGYFDPWVTPIISAVPPNEVALYQCPMHEGIRSQSPGVCPLCGMELIAINRQLRPPGMLHDASYAMNITAEERGPLEAVFHLRPAKQDKPVPLALVHEQLMHVIVVSEDLAYFDHVHPVVEGDSSDGRFALAYRFPRPGRYVIYLDTTPKGDRQQVFREVVDARAARISLGGDVTPAHLALDAAPSKLVYPVACGATPQTQAPLDKTLPANTPATGPNAEPVIVQLVSQPRTLYAGLHSELVFKLSDARGRPLTDLAKYIGAMGHCVALSEDTADYLHSHPEQLMTPTDADRGGPVVAFHAIFPKPGRYRIWGQFRRPARTPGMPDDLIIADFTVEVKAPLVPARLINFLLY